MFDTVSNKRIAIFGFAFKKNTADTRFLHSVTHKIFELVKMIYEIP